MHGYGGKGSVEIAQNGWVGSSDDAHLQSSLAEENGLGLTSRLVPACSPSINLSGGKLQMTL